jgi:hypothetical protein
VAKSRLLAPIVGWRSDGRGSFPGLVLFNLVTPPLKPEGVGAFPDTGCMVPQLFATRRNRSYLEFYAVTSSPRYPGYLPRQ